MIRRTSLFLAFLALMVCCAATVVAETCTTSSDMEAATRTALVTAGVETDVLGIGRDDLAREDLEAVVAAHPRPDFKQQILAAFTEGMKHRPQTTFGTCNADVLERFDPTFVRDNFVDNILGNTWPE